MLAKLWFATERSHLARNYWALALELLSPVIPRLAEPSKQFLYRHAQCRGDGLHSVERWIGAASLYA